MLVSSTVALGRQLESKENGKLVYEEPEKSLYPVIARQLGGSNPV